MHTHECGENNFNNFSIKKLQFFSSQKFYVICHCHTLLSWNISLPLHIKTNNSASFANLFTGAN